MKRTRQHERLDLDGAVVTTDAMGCQTAVAEKIVAGNADDLLPVKGQQPKLEAELEALFGEGPRGDPHAVTCQMFADVDTGARPGRDPPVRDDRPD